MVSRTARLSPEQRRAAILKAAQDCFSEGGYYDTTVDQIAERAGVSKGAIYWHFQGKREIFTAILDEEVLGKVISYQPLLEDSPSALDGLRNIIKLVQDIVQPNLDLAELRLEYMSHACRDERIRAKFREMYELITSVMARQVERGVEEGTFQPVDAQAAAMILASTLDGLHLRKIFVPSMDLEQLFRRAEDLFVRALQDHP